MRVVMAVVTVLGLVACGTTSTPKVQSQVAGISTSATPAQNASVTLPRHGGRQP